MKFTRKSTEITNDSKPAYGKKSFHCPHCGALAHQHWFSSYAKPVKNPLTLNLKNLLKVFKYSTFEEAKSKINDEINKLKQGDTDLGKEARDKKFTLDVLSSVQNKKISLSNPNDNAHLMTVGLSFSSCFSCEELSIWHFDTLIYPQNTKKFIPNPDLPDDIKKDFEEAAEIVDLSPRGAAALLRLCLQKLLKELGEEGKSINKDIGSLVKKGLDPLIQQACDNVRLIGNDAVHPGQIDADDKETVYLLFAIVNDITERMISHPKKVKATYAALPNSKKAGIQHRDNKTP